MPEQLTLDLPLRPAMGRDDFFVSAANAGAVALIDNWRDWPHGKLVLVGDEGAGKTHLAHVFASQSNAVIVPVSKLAQYPLGETPPAMVVEDADAVAGDGAAEEALFHLHNALLQTGAPLLLTARHAPARWGLTLPDLASRMAQAGLARLDPPDDALLLAVMAKRVMDRKLPLTPDMLTYLAPRIPRSFAAAEAVIARIDALSLSQKRRPTQTHGPCCPCGHLG